MSGSILRWSILAAGVAGHLALASADDPVVAAKPGSELVRQVPPVLRNGDAPDNRVVLLPQPVVSTARSEAVTPPRLPEAARTPEPALAPPARPSPPPPVKVAAPARRPADFDKDSLAYCQRRIAKWTEKEARALLGAPQSQRPARDRQGLVIGRILAFSDPSGRHKRLELDFNTQTGLLRTVYVYPRDMWWEECLRKWGTGASAMQATQGRTFYSYTDRRLDVLAEPSGRVLSLGIY